MDEMLNLYEDLSLTPTEKAVASTIMLYLVKVGGEEARKVMLPVVDVKMYQLDVEKNTASGDKAHYKVTPVNSVIDGKKLATLIDLAVTDSANAFEDGWMPDEPEGIAEKDTVLGNLGSIMFCGSCVVHSSSCFWLPPFLRQLLFLVAAYYRHVRKIAS